jgi:formylmethanofuran dehydrogenase subunit C
MKTIQDVKNELIEEYTDSSSGIITIDGRASAFIKTAVERGAKAHEEATRIEYEYESDEFVKGRNEGISEVREKSKQFFEEI